MIGKLPHNWRAAGLPGHATFIRGTGVGLAGGLVGTITMDLFAVGLLPVIRAPATAPFVIIGDTAAGFFSGFGLEIAGGAPLGALLHYLIGLALGAIFGAALARIDGLRVNSRAKAAGLGILYIEIVSLPIGATAPIILRMTTSETMQWFGISFVMHLVYGLVLGIVTWYGLSRGLKGDG